MNIRYKNYNRRKFKEWKNRVSVHLPALVINFYNQDHVHYEDHVLLGKVIHWINSPQYSLIDFAGKHTDAINEMADQICLELLVNDLFKLVNTTP